MQAQLQIGGRGFYFRLVDYDWGQKILIQFVTLKNYRPWNGFGLRYSWVSFRQIQIELLDWNKGHKVGLQIQSPIRRRDYGKL